MVANHTQSHVPAGEFVDPKDFPQLYPALYTVDMDVAQTFLDNTGRREFPLFFALPETTGTPGRRMRPNDPVLEKAAGPGGRMWAVR